MAVKLLFPEAEVTRSLSNNLLKAWGVSPNPEEEVRVIDNNEVIAKRLEWLMEQKVLPKKAAVGNMPMAKTEESMEAALLLGETGEAGPGFVEGLAAEQIEVYEGPDAEELVAQAQAEAEQILESARAEAAAIRQSAQEEGRQQGYASGLQEAQAQMQEKLQSAETQIRQKAEKLEDAYWNKVSELEPAFVDTLTGIYEHIFRVKLSEEKQLILNLLTEALHGIEGSREFIVHVSAADIQNVRAAKQELTDAAVSPDAKIDIIEDATLNKNDCLIETGSGIFDCSLDTQLKELKKQIKLLSYEK